MALIHSGGFDVEAWEISRKAGLSKEKAKEALLMAAQIIREGKPLPMGMAEWLAGAIESAINSPFLHAPDSGDTGHALLVALGFRNNNRRKSVDWLDVGDLVERRIYSGMNKTTAIRGAAAEIGIGYGTAQSAYSKYCEAKKGHDRISREEVEKPPRLSD